jgi:polysaccharide deacetylase family protein (PEP-CTERM system associated)
MIGPTSDGPRGNDSQKSFDGALTIDLEDWRCALNPDPNADYRRRPPLNEEYLRESTVAVLRELDAVGARATFFVLGEVARAVPEVVRDLVRKGHEVASHSPVHLPPRMIPRDEMARLMKLDVSFLEDLTGFRPMGFRAPYLAIRRNEGWLLKILSELGFLYDSSIAPTRTPYWGIPTAPKGAYFPDFTDLARPLTSGPLLELPLTVWPTWKHLPGLPIAGGFYMRAWPMPLLTYMLKRNVQSGFPLVIYIHPGNLESAKHRIEKPTMRDRISQYAGSGRGLSSFRNILNEFEFGTMSAVFDRQLNALKRQRLDER